MKRNVYVIGFILFIVVMLLFFVMNIFFRDVEYFKNSVLISAFVLPIIFAAGAYYSVTTFSRWKKVISFKEVYGRAFIPMFVAGLLSMLSIYVYITYIDADTNELLNYQFIESRKNSLEEEYAQAKKIIKPDTAEMQELEEKYQEGKDRIAYKIEKEDDMFSLKYFAYIFAGYCAFFLLISLFFGAFFRTKTIE